MMQALMNERFAQQERTFPSERLEYIEVRYERIVHVFPENVHNMLISQAVC